MEEKKQDKKKSRGIIWIVIAIFAVFSLIAVSAMRPGGKSEREGWLEHKVSDLWSADYQRFDGTRDATLEAEGTVLRISTRTESGTLGISITDSKDNEIFSKQGLGTEEFEIEVPQAVHVTLTAQEHTGGFQIEYVQ